MSKVKYLASKHLRNVLLQNVGWIEDMKLYGGRNSFAGSQTVYIYTDNQNPSPSWSSRLLSTNRGFATYKTYDGKIYLPG